MRPRLSGSNVAPAAWLAIGWAATACSAGGGKSASCPVFPADSAWNTRISDYPPHPMSRAWIASMGGGALAASELVPVATVAADQAAVPVSFDSPENSDDGPWRLPADARISRRDRRVVALDAERCQLYELYNVTSTAPWHAAHGSIFDLGTEASRRSGWARPANGGTDPLHDCSGLPVYPGLIRYDELVTQGAIAHALRVNSAISQRAYIPPATHAGSPYDNPEYPPMGARLRLKADADCSGYAPTGRALCDALKAYGLLLAHNGPTWTLSVEDDPRWPEGGLEEIGRLHGSDFEFVQTGNTIAYGENFIVHPVRPPPDAAL